MRFLELELLSFGPFTDRHLDFVGGGESGDTGLQLIFGSNEAGKSTALRAVSGLLFGIPETTRDDHVHKKGLLRIGAHLESQSGDRLSCVRRKGRVDTLLDPSEKRLDEALLTKWLGGVSRELFDVMFGLSHAALVQGGEDLLAGKGELGESLFAAGIGVRGIHDLRRSLSEEADKIFKPRGINPGLNKALRSFDEWKKKSRQASLKPRAWQELDQRLRDTEREYAAQTREQKDLQKEHNRLRRLQRVLPGLQKRQALCAKLEDLGKTKLLPESCSTERTKAQNNSSNAALQVQKLVDEQKRLEEERASLHVPEELLARESELENLRDSHGAHKKEMLDLPVLVGRVASLEEDARNLLQELGRSESLDELDKLRIDAALQARIRGLGKNLDLLAESLKNTQKVLANHDRKIRDLEDRGNELPPRQDSGTLSRAVEQARKRGDLEAELRTRAVDIASLEKQAGSLLSALGLWPGPLEEVEGLPLPPEETIGRFQDQFAELEKGQDHAKDRRAEIAARLEEITSQITELESGGTVPTEEELHGARTKRDVGWQGIRAVWLEGAPLGDETAEGLAAGHEQSIRQTDDVADRLRHEAERVAMHFTLCEERQRQERALEKIDQELSELATGEAALAEDWRVQWRPAKIEPRPPAEMSAWLGRHERLVAAIRELMDCQAKQEVLHNEIESHRDRCSRELEEIDAAKASSDESLASLLDRAESVAKRIGELEQQRRIISKDLESAREERQALQEDASEDQDELKTKRRQWGEALLPLGLDAHTSPDGAEAVLALLANLFEKVKDITNSQTRIDHIESNARRFAERVTGLTNACAPGLAGAKPSEAAAELAKRLDLGRINQTKRHGLDERLQQIGLELQSLERNRESAQAALKRLMEYAGCKTTQELEELEQRSKKCRETRSKLEDLEQQLLAEGLPIEELLAQADAADPDGLQGEIESLEVHVAESDAELERLNRELGTLKQEQRGMDGSDTAAEAAAEAQEALAALRGHVENHVRLKLAALLLNREIERHRQQNQGPILERAGELFRRITLDSFTSLSTGFTDADDPVLLCVRSSGERVPVEGLSEGTNDQLYLALRLASIEEHLEGGEPLPLVIDDALIKFDDLRAQATLKILHELSAKTQVLFFTHHHRLVELASEAIPAGRFRVHDLDRKSGG